MEMESFELPEELPLFPLSTVLFPGTLLPLHVFEERYKEMMQYAIDHGGMYGLSFRDDASAGRESIPEVGHIGCLAKINAVMPLEEGRMNIISTGIIRYRVTGYMQMVPFLIAHIETFTDELEHDTELTRLFESMEKTGKELMEAAQQLDETNGVFNSDLPDDPEGFSMIMSALLPLNHETKQKLLEMTSTKTRLVRLRGYMISTLSDYHARIDIRNRAKTNGHGKLPEKS
jgi:Lon protease-like protein